MSENATRAEVCAAAVADAFADDGEIFASPMGTMPMLGVRLAKLTSNPDLVISDGESLWLGGVPPIHVKQEVVAYGKRHVMMGATQIDRQGNQNISAIGDFAQPKRQLLGSRGAPGNTVNNRTSYWVPKHNPRVFVEQVDVVSGVGPARAKAAGKEAARFNDIHRIVTNLCVLDVKGPGDTVRLVSVHPGVTIDEVREATGFDLAVADTVTETRSPSYAELVIIREMLDPKKLREREVPEKVSEQ